MRVVLVRVLAWLAAAALLPGCWAATWALGVTLPPVLLPAEGARGGFFLVSPAWALASGTLVYAIWHRLRPPEFLYTFAHEATHMAFALLSGKKVHGLAVSRSSGSVALSGTNPLITLSPYFFPLPAVLVLAVGGAFQWALEDGRIRLGTAFFVGFCLAFHLVMTLRTLRSAQPDIQRGGRLFSWVAIYLAGVILLGGTILVAIGGPATLLPFGRSLLAECWAAYAWIGPRLLAASEHSLSWSFSRWNL